MNQETKEFIEFLDKSYGQKEVYMWSTYILPNGNFLNPENNEDVDTDMLDYEHSDFFDYLPLDQFITMGEDNLMQYAIKMNVTYPYIILPKNRITAEQTNAIKKIIYNSDRFIYNIEDIVERIANWSNEAIDDIPSMLYQPLLVEHETMGSKIFDLMQYSANDIIKEIIRAYSRGTF
jgi:hypothetical protein